LCNFTCIAGLFGIAGAVVAVMAIIGAIFVYPWTEFAWDKNSISSLGAVAKPYVDGHVVLHPQVLDYGLMIAGVLLVVFSLGLLFGRKGQMKDTISTIGSIIFLISAVGVFGVGFFPLPDSHPHGISAMVAFVGIAVALFFFFRTSKIMPKLAGLTGLISLVGIVLFVIVLQKVYGINYGLAAPEMVIIVPAIFWIIPVSIIMIKGKLDTITSG